MAGTPASPLRIELAEFGTGGVGKTALLHRFNLDIFIDTYDPTLEDEYRKSVVIDSQVVSLTCRDVGGQDDYAIMHEQAARSCDGSMIVYSVASKWTLDDVLRYHQTIKKYSKYPATIPIFVVGNKSDLVEGRQVTFEEGQQLAEQLGCRFYETSAKLGTNVNQVFTDLARQALVHAKGHAEERVRMQKESRLRDTNCFSRCVVA